MPEVTKRSDQTHNVRFSGRRRIEAAARGVAGLDLARYPLAGRTGRFRLSGTGRASRPAFGHTCGPGYSADGRSRPNAVSRTVCSSARNGGRSSAERRATNPER